MSVLFYNIFLWGFKAVTHIAALFNLKAKKWVVGRKNIFEKLEQAIPKDQKIVWMHCASLGEFEQGRPVLEKLRSNYPHYKYLLTFFSPSGYEVQKNYKGVDWVFYLPIDGPVNAKRFLEIVHPSLVIFVKYEFWFYYLKKIKYRNIPLLLISASFRKDMSFFKWYGALQRKMLSRFDHLFVQNNESKKLVDELGLQQICTVSGDTRFDRVIEIANKFEAIPLLEKFIGKAKLVIAGSTWPDDEEALQKAFALMGDNPTKFIIAPHEINENRLAEIETLFPASIRFSQLANKNVTTENCLIIDNMGMLSRLYKYAYLTYIGGGLRTMGVHNVLEPAVYYKPVLFGPFYQKYSEAIGLVEAGGGLFFYNEKKDGVMLFQLIETLLNKEEEYKTISKTAGDFVQENKGATQKIIQFIQEKRLLTN